MKKILFSLFTVACSYASMAQRVEIDSINTGGFVGVKPFMEGEFYYAVYAGGTTTQPATNKYNLRVYNRDLMEGAIVSTEVPETSKLIAQSFTGEFIVMAFIDEQQKKRTIQILNQQNEIVKTNIEENINTNTVGKAWILSVSPRDFVLVTPDPDGFKMTRMDVDMNIAWSKTFKPDNGRWQISKLIFAGDLIGVVREELKGENLDNYAYTIQGISANSGTERFAKSLNGVPGFVNIDREMNISLGGISYKNGKPDKNPEAVFFTVFNANGSTKMESNTPLQMVEGIAANDVTKAIAKGDIRMQIESLFLRGFEEGYTLIGETYKVSQSTAAVQEIKEGRKGKNKKAIADPAAMADITVMDLVLLTFNKEGMFTGFSKVDKASKQATMKGEIATLPAPLMADRLQDAGFFGYAGSVEMHMKQYIGFVGEKESKRKLYFFEAGTTPAKDASGIDIDEEARSGKYEFDEINNSIPGFGMLPGREGGIMLYKVNEPKLIMWKEQVPMNDTQADQGQPLQPVQPNAR